VEIVDNPHMDIDRLKVYLDNIYKRFDIRYLSPDPLEYLHRVKKAEDREIVGLIASSLAYGKVEMILKSVDQILVIMGYRPYDFVTNFSPKRDGKRLNGFTHRFNRGVDIACLIYLIQQVIEENGSLGNFFLKGYSNRDNNIRPALTHFVEGMLSLDSSPFYGSKDIHGERGIRYLLPSPRRGSACKRLNLFLRWMVRRGDPIDFGIWDKVSPAKLIIPLDTHIARISRNIGLSSRRNADWQMAEEITGNLKKLDPDDPVKYDFAISRLGILNRCPSKRDKSKCSKCAIKEICRSI